MPRYSYYCEACETTSSMFHSINTIIEECPLCLETKFFYKLVSKPSYGSKTKAEEEGWLIVFSHGVDPKSGYIETRKGSTLFRPIQFGTNN